MVCGLAGQLTVRVGTGNENRNQCCCFLWSVRTSCSFFWRQRPCSSSGTQPMGPFSTGVPSFLGIYSSSPLRVVLLLKAFYYQTLTCRLLNNWTLSSVLSFCVLLPQHRDSPPADRSRGVCPLMNCALLLALNEMAVKSEARSQNRAKHSFPRADSL